MKTLRLFLGMFVVAVCVSFSYVCAESSVSWLPVELGRYSETYTSGANMKTVYGNQYIIQTTAVDSITGASDRAVEARTVNSSLGSVYSSWVDTVKGEYVTWDGTAANGNKESAYNYKMQLRASSSTFAKVKFYGTWSLIPFNN